jgi:succinyl-CoA synthetase beta subunit
VLANSLDMVEAEATRILSERLVTRQTGPAGLPVSYILVESPTDIAEELYLSALVDRATRRVLMMASRAGGMNIEEVAAETPEQIVTTLIDPAAGVQAYQARRLGFALGFSGEAKQFQKILFGLVKLFHSEDASLVEINPLVVTRHGDLLALDAKINLDSNALYRHADLVKMRDISQEDAREAEAAEHDLNYITLDGRHRLHGQRRRAGDGDHGPGAAARRLTGQLPRRRRRDDRGAGGRGLQDHPLGRPRSVRAVLVNIFGGIVRCDLIAEGIIAAVREVGIECRS